MVVLAGILMSISMFVSQSASFLFERPEEITTFTEGSSVFSEETMGQPTPMTAIGGHCG
jgi:hypothetical protein